MATASTEKARAVQSGNHTFSATAQDKLICARCGGLMVHDLCMDVLGNLGESEFTANRCVQCGEVVDPVILRNRATNHEAMMVPPARVLSH